MFIRCQPSLNVRGYTYVNFSFQIRTILLKFFNFRLLLLRCKVYERECETRPPHPGEPPCEPSHDTFCMACAWAAGHLSSANSVRSVACPFTSSKSEKVWNPILQNTNRRRGPRLLTISNPSVPADFSVRKSLLWANPCSYPESGQMGRKGIVGW